MEQLGTYKLSGSLTNQNAGYSVWGFGKKNGMDYFIKQFISQKYPANDTVSSAERLQKKIKECECFEQRKIAVYKALNDNSDGNAVRVEEFFRIESKYYISMRKIKALPLDIESIASLPIDEIRRLCCIIAHAVASFHKGRVVHADLKHDSVIFMKTESGLTTAKVIDFDSSFLETDPPSSGEEIIGDLVYFSPEACISIWGEEIELTCKMDVFALGVLFHQYFTGKLPDFNTDESAYPGEAVAKGETLSVSDELPEDIKELLIRMLNYDPLERPTAMEVFKLLRNDDSLQDELEVEEEEKEIEEENIKSNTAEFKIKTPSKTAADNPFFMPGDL